MFPILCKATRRLNNRKKTNMATIWGKCEIYLNISYSLFFSRSPVRRWKLCCEVVKYLPQQTLCTDTEQCTYRQTDANM